MSVGAEEATFSDFVAQSLPYLRRYARALTGSQKSGDKYTIATLDVILRDRSIVEAAASIREGLFQCFHAIWVSSGRQLDMEEEGIVGRAHGHLAKLTVNSREVLLLNTIEEFSVDEIARIIGTDVEDVQHLLEVAIADIAKSSAGKVMIIEDEPIIADDLSDIVSDLGHRVTGIARTRDEAVALGKAERPDLILADIQLADNSSGIDAVNDLLNDFDIPVVFITAFPERLLTGDRPEPAFLISKPFKVKQIRSAVSQAMFFSSTETLQNAS
ncbi:response regulator receiver protein [Cognatiyoonia koreensis]|uniref:Response regulator receiver protein n=1 Tax=Cognatiyoonia koreensis TaxID=364200 RepID=A0A1I0PX18_9RHOB|nr:response regulator [Cognatiyoonia koreensis]SEW19029.1 response regulator receiver protein [Cognatiyoonia koreensis]